jgi:hypothetical protein
VLTRGFTGLTLVALLTAASGRAARPERAVAAAAALEPQAITAVLDYGPHSVGFRFASEVDYSRNARPWLDAGDPGVDGGTQVEIGVWYPAARPSTAPMSAAAYRSLLVPFNLDTGAEGFRRTAARGGIPMTAAQAADTLRRPTRAFRDAERAPGSFPLVVEGGFFSGTWLVNEYLASHGYVVVMITNSGRTATLQSALPAIALETHVRNLEFATAFARQQGLGDATRLAVLGVNFDGMPALIYEMRNVMARAVVSIDGIEAKVATSTAGVRSAFFDPARMRVPYLIFVQDDQDVPPGLAHDRTVWNALSHSTRYWFVLKGFNHIHLIGDLGHAPALSREQNDSYVFFHRTVRRFLDAYVRDDARERATLETEPPAARIPRDLGRAAVRVLAQPAR